MQDGEKMSLEQIRQFLEASDEMHFNGKGRATVYGWVARTLRRHSYHRQGRAAKGLLRQYLIKMTGLSRAQVTRLIQQYREGKDLAPARYRRAAPPAGSTRLPARRYGASRRSRRREGRLSHQRRG